MKLLLLAAALTTGPAALVSAAETVLGVYVFHRHGDRTTKSYPPTSLTPLGAYQVFQSGAFYRERYVKVSGQGGGESSGDNYIAALSDGDHGAVVPGQVLVSSPRDSVLRNSATTFLQGLYPPLGAAGVQTLANGSVVQAPLGGYQYVPVADVSDSDAATAADAEHNAWLQGNSGCANAVVSSKSYFSSSEFAATAASSADFFRNLLPVINSTFSPEQAAFKNAYSIFDYVNVATIHNQSIPSGDLVPPAMPRLFELASIHEWNLAYNASEPVRAIAGSVLAGQVFDALNALVKTHTTTTDTRKKTAPAFNAQFGAYGTFMAFFGLAGLSSVSPDFESICNYASSMAFELVTNSSSSKDGAYDEKDLYVRFFFANGTASADSFTQYPLFGGKDAAAPLAWPAFRDGINKFAIKDTAHWCNICGGNSGKCAASTNGNSDVNAEAKANGGSGSGGISRPVAGVIGALVTLAVVSATIAAVMLFGGFRLMKKSAVGSSVGGRGSRTAGFKA